MSSASTRCAISPTWPRRVTENDHSQSLRREKPGTAYSNEQRNEPCRYVHSTHVVIGERDAGGVAHAGGWSDHPHLEQARHDMAGILSVGKGTDSNVRRRPLTSLSSGASAIEPNHAGAGTAVRADADWVRRRLPAGVVRATPDALRDTAMIDELRRQPTAEAIERVVAEVLDTLTLHARFSVISRCSPNGSP